MALELTERAQKEIARVNIQPNVILEIDGIDTAFGAISILRVIKVGEPGLLINGGWVVGGLTEVEDQLAAVSMGSGGGSATKIDQQLRPDKGSVSSVSGVQLELVDFNQKISETVSPGVLVTDILARKAKLYMGFNNTAYKEDYVEIFSGIIDDVEAGPSSIKLSIAHPDQKKRQEIFNETSTTLSAGISSGVTTIPLTSIGELKAPVLGPDGVTYDSSIKFYVRINNEVIRYTGISGLSLTGATRGQLGTTAVAHSSGDEVTSLVALEGSAIDLALKLMLSGTNGPYVEILDVKSFVSVPPSGSVANSVFLEADLVAQYNVRAGDYITTTGATSGANNVSNKEILSVNETTTGTYLVIDGVTFVTENPSPAILSIRSQYDTLGEGLSLDPDQVDIAEHVYWNDLILSSFLLRFYIKETISGKDFLEQQVYAPTGAYSIPRKGRCSMGYHIGPLPRQVIPILDKDVIKSPSKIKIRRSVNRHFYNTVIYRFEESALDDKFLAGTVYQNADSKGRIPIGNKALTFDAKGYRLDLGALTSTASASNRYLSRYKYAAEFIESLEVFFKAGFNLEPGDIVVFDPTDLNVLNTEDGTRNKREKLYEIINKSLDLRTGNVTLSIVDSNFSGQERFGLIAPSSVLASGSTSTVLRITESFGALFPDDEAKKWDEYVGLPILVHNESWTFEEETTLVSISANDRHALTVSPALSISPSAGYIIDIPNYSTSTDKSVNSIYKLLHAHLSPTVPIVSGISTTQFTVSAGNVGKFFVGADLIIHNASFTDINEDRVVTDVTGNTITIEPALSFSPTSSHFVDSIGFADKQGAYRWI